MNAPATPAPARDPHWTLRPEHDTRTWLPAERRGLRRPGHSLGMPCAACLAPKPAPPRSTPAPQASRATVAPKAPERSTPAAERPTVPVRGDRALPPTLRPVAPQKLPAPATPALPRELPPLGTPLREIDGPTVRQALVMALGSLGPGSHDVCALVVAAWKRWPEKFGLRHYEQTYPDSNRVFSKLSGEDGLSGMGLCRSTETGRIELTAAGVRRAKQLEGRHGGR